MHIHIYSIVLSCVFCMQVLPNGFQLFVRVIDNDGYFHADLIDEVYLHIPPNLNLTVASQTIAGIFDRAVLIMEYSLTCTQNYYGSDCSTYCVPSDNSMGHYNCAPSNGSKICLPEYQNPDTNCTESEKACNQPCWHKCEAISSKIPSCRSLFSGVYWRRR